MKKYVLVEDDFDIYEYSSKKISPILKIDNDKLFFNNKEYELNGLPIEKWLPLNYEKLKHTIASKGKDGSNEEVITYLYVFNENMILKEIFLDEDEDYFINYKIDEQTYKKDITQLNLLLTDLENIFHHVEPHKANKNTFSMFLRDIIIKSSTEVETHWKELMKLNGYKKENLTTKDYSKLMEFINFNFHIKLENYPTYDEVIPFLNWNIENPTKSLKWYNVYNILKHDRTNSLSNATLCNAINSVGAVFILVNIRYSNLTTLHDKIELSNEIKKVFKITKMVNVSKWKLYTPYKFSMKINYIKYFEK